MRTHVYIDGFNLYYGLLRGTPWKWLNLEVLFDALLPRNEVVRIRYFTARVQARLGDGLQPVRQATYLRALATLPRVEIVYGSFLSQPSRKPLLALDANGRYRRNSDGSLVLDTQADGQIRRAWTMKTEEKGSDVNLAAHLLRDGFLARSAFDCAVIVSNDSDLLTPIGMAKTDCGLTIGLVPPRPDGSRELKRLADFVIAPRNHHLDGARFPEILHDARGEIRKPKGW